MDSLSDFVSNMWYRITSLGKAIVGVAGPAVTTMVDALRRGVEAVQYELRRGFRDHPATKRERIDRELEDVNCRTMLLRKRYYERGHLSASDKRQNERLHRQRAELAKELEALDQTATAEVIVKEADKYRPLQINVELTHILQYHVGQSTFNKNCRVCGRAMLLQYKREQPVAAIDDFFWVCIGNHSRKKHCQRAEPLSASDFNLFVNVCRPEFDLAPIELSDLLFEQHPKKVQEAMRDLIVSGQRTRNGIDGYRCPIHKERLLLREKRSPARLIDQFLLGCPRYDKDDNGCNYLVKIKSPAQFSAVFEATGEGGLIQVIDSGSAPPIAVDHEQLWTAELDAHVVRAYEQRLSIAQICAIFQRSETSIRFKLQQLGKISLDDANGAREPLTNRS